MLNQPLPIMKKFTLFITLLFAVSLAFAQGPTIHDPNAKATITQEQIDAWRDKVPKAPASGGVVTLNFEGIGTNVPIGDYYNGGAGPNYGVSFSSNALAIIENGYGGTGNFTNEPSPYACLFFMTGSPVMNVAAGFTTGFSFYFTSSNTITLFVYDGLDGTGNLLASQSFPVNYQNGGCSGAGFCHWDPVGIGFSGTAKSIVFTGAANQCGFDDVTFGSITPGPTAVPTLSEWGLIIMGLTLLAFGTFYILKMRG